MMEKDLLPLKDYAAMLVTLLIQRREQENKAPVVAFLPELLAECRKDMLDVLRDYVRDGTLECHKDLNGTIMFEFKQPKR